MDKREEIRRAASEEYQLVDGEKIIVGPLRPEDAPGIAKLFRTVYGDGYPVKLFYDPEGLIKAFDSGDNYSLTARKANGDVIGHMAAFRSSPYANLYEAGAGMVLPEYRNEGINKMLLTQLYERLLYALGIDESWGEAVCNHVYMQRTVHQYRHIETGLEVDLMPAEAYVKEKSAPGRVASLVCFRAYRSRPHTVYLPAPYENALRFLYSALDAQRSLEESGEPFPSNAASRATVQTFEFARVARVSVTETGNDFDAYFDTLEKELLSKETRVVQVGLNLARPWVGKVVAILRKRGYFLGGVLPRWFDDDGLLMQKIIGRPDWEGVQLFSDRARQILDMIKGDWESVS